MVTICIIFHTHSKEQIYWCIMKSVILPGLPMEIFWWNYQSWSNGRNLNLSLGRWGGSELIFKARVQTLLNRRNKSRHPPRSKPIQNKNESDPKERTGNHLRANTIYFESCSRNDFSIFKQIWFHFNARWIENSFLAIRKTQSSRVGSAWDHQQF